MLHTQTMINNKKLKVFHYRAGLHVCHGIFFLIKIINCNIRLLNCVGFHVRDRYISLARGGVDGPKKFSGWSEMFTVPVGGGQKMNVIKSGKHICRTFQFWGPNNATELWGSEK